MFATAVYTNQSREGEYGLRGQREEMRNLKKVISKTFAVIFFFLFLSTSRVIFFFVFFFFDFYLACPHPLLSSCLIL